MMIKKQHVITLLGWLSVSAMIVALYLGNSDSVMWFGGMGTAFIIAGVGE